jgi:hypothetical protein
MSTTHRRANEPIRMGSRTGVLAPLFWGLFGLSLAVEFKAGPTLLGADVVTLFVLPITMYEIARRPHCIPKQVWTIVLLLLLWFASATASDFFNHTSLANRIRGQSIIVVYGAALLTLAAFVGGRRDRELTLAMAIALGLVVKNLINPEWPRFTDVWKFELGMPIAVALAILLDPGRRVSLQKMTAQIVSFAALAVTSLLLDFRSLAAFLLLCAAFVIKKFRLRPESGAEPTRRTPAASGSGRTFRSLLFMSTAIVCIYLGYTVAATSGWLGRGAADKASQQTSGTFGVLIGGRPEILISAYAIGQKPNLGFGSWPQNCTFLALYEQLKVKYGVTSKQQEHECLIPTHSHLFGAWVSAGILAVPVWIYTLWIVGGWCLRAIRDRSYFEAAPLLMGGIVVWNVLFSPFSGSERISDAFYIAVIMSRFSPKEGRK